METSQISVGLALLAGLASFLSPCVFSLVPAYVGYLGGLSAGDETGKSNRWVTFSHGLAFVLGFSVVFVLLGVAASFAGGLLYDLRFWLSKIGGIVVVVFGLHMIGVFHIPFLAYDTRVQQAPDPKLGYLSSALMGVFFSAGWSPCVGPVLGAILIALKRSYTFDLSGYLFGNILAVTRRDLWVLAGAIVLMDFAGARNWERALSLGARAVIEKYLRLPTHPADTLFNEVGSPLGALRTIGRGDT